jgi:tetratricopeptide (TPR) repeat protein
MSSIHMEAIAVRKLGRLLAVAVGFALVMPLGLGQIGLSSSSTAAAQQNEGSRRQEEAPRRVQPMTERTYRRLAEAQEMLDADQFDQALRHLQGMLNLRGLNPSELGQIHNMLAYTHFQQERYNDAIRHYEEIAALGENVARGLEVQTLYSLAQLYMLTERYQRALDYLNMWMQREPEAGPEPYVFRGQLNYQLQNFPNAIRDIEHGIELARNRGTQVRENWWQLLMFLNFEQDNMPRVVEILEILVRDFPKRDYWIQLAGMYGQMGQEARQVQAMESAHSGDFFERESDYVSYAGLLAQAGVPYRAARALAEGMERGIVEQNERHLRSLAQYWHMAQEVEQAIPVYERSARLAPDGRTFAQLATLYLDRNDLGRCVTASDQALERGDLRSRANVFMVRSMCQFEDDRLSDARSGFQECARVARQENDQSMLRVCQQWVTHVERESQRRETLRAGL